MTLKMMLIIVVKLNTNKRNPMGRNAYATTISLSIPITISAPASNILITATIKINTAYAPISLMQSETQK